MFSSIIVQVENMTEEDIQYLFLCVCALHQVFSVD